jgi:hypothetical protein
MSLLKKDDINGILPEVLNLREDLEFRFAVPFVSRSNYACL